MPTYTSNAPQDTYLNEVSPNSNNQNVTTYTTTDNSGTRKNILLRFAGISTIPSFVIVTAVSLRMRCTAAISSGGTLTIRRVLRPWVVSQATWNIYSTGNNWQTAGCQGADDRINSTSDDIVQPASNTYFTFSSKGLVDDVTAWLRGTTNNGWLIEVSGGSKSVTAASAENGTTDYRPLLTVQYIYPPGKSRTGLAGGVGMG